MFYISFLTLFFISSFITNKKDNNKLTLVFISILTFCLSLRFGQGTDYFNYGEIYLSIPNSYDNIFPDCLMKYSVEPLYYLLNVFAKDTGIGFQFVIIICAVFSSCLIYITIKKYSRHKLFSVFILFTNYFFYFQSAIRQSTAMAIFIYSVCEYLNDRKIWKYLLFVLLGMCFHTACIISLVIPVLLKIKWKGFLKLRTFLILSFILIPVGMFLPRIMLTIVAIIIPKYAYYATGVMTLNIAPIGIRFIFSFFALYYYKRITSDFDKKLLKIYLLGSLIYFSVSSIGVFSRLTDFLTFIEILLFPNIIPLKSLRKYSMVTGLIMILFSALFVKDLNESYIQGSYYSPSFLDYPYVSIFDKGKIFEVRNVVQPNATKFLNGE